ncbi:hypothetical protein PUR61_43190 [Streptomyces sp. BE20]|uniref:hypothetical protein n=1 Tax=Streptomyces sp. BE20 TaxID=3002525 RepID=UPI002E7752F7|nr:hypothetical protein [Streptomyces sp. BE20]MEE1828926.1 hypothetical protein [Streptomyces sp. BE20]
MPIEFKEPAQAEGHIGRLSLPGPRGPESLRFILKGEEVTISGFERQLPEPSSASSRGKLVKAGLADSGTALDEDGWHAVARAVVHPEGVAAQLRTQTGLASALIEEHVEGATLRSIHARVWLTELFPGLQPRTGQESLPIADPAVRGMLEESAGEGAPRPLATVSYVYRDLQHLHDHLRQTITYTRRANPNPYDQSILARRITRAVIAHPCRLEFEDDTEPIHVLVVRDGITRITSAWALLAGDDATPDEIARLASECLLAEKPTRRGSAERSLSQRQSLGRQEQLDHLRGEFLRGLDETPSDRAVRIGQTLVVPAQIAVGLQAYPGGALPEVELFDDAVRSILASVHVEFKGWDAAAQNVEVGSRALRRVVLSGQVQTDIGAADLSDIVDLAVGRIKVEALPTVFRDKAIPPTALWRAVYLVHALTRPSLYREVKRHAMDIKGTRAMKFIGYAELLGPIVDLPWRGAKKAVLQQARNAWANGGVITADVRGSWEPVPTERLTELVPAALAGDFDARMTITVAGGIALITDKLLTRNVGSAVGRTVPFRADVHAVIADLSRQGNEAGLWLLAHAADRFEADRQAKNSLTDAQLTRVTDLTPYYTHVRIDVSASDKVARDPGGAELALDQYAVVATSDVSKAEKAQQELSDSANDGKELSIDERAAIERAGLLRALQTANDRLSALTALTQGTTLEGFGSKDEWDPLYKLSSKLLHAIYNGGTTLVGTEVFEENEESEENEE